MGLLLWASSWEVFLAKLLQLRIPTDITKRPSSKRSGLLRRAALLGAFLLRHLRADDVEFIDRFTGDTELVSQVDLSSLERVNPFVTF